MSFFNKKKNEVVDLRTSSTQRARRTISDTNRSNEDSQKMNSPINDGYATLGFLGGIANTEGNSSFNSPQKYESFEDNSLNPEEKRSKLAKRLLDMTNKMEDLSNQIYHVTQRLELIEKRLTLNKS